MVDFAVRPKPNIAAIMIVIRTAMMAKIIMYRDKTCKATKTLLEDSMPQESSKNAHPHTSKPRIVKYIPKGIVNQCENVGKMLLVSNPTPVTISPKENKKNSILLIF